MLKKGYFYAIISISILLTGCANQATKDPFLESYNKIQNTYKAETELNQCMSDSLNKCMTSIVTSKATKSMDESICSDLKNEELKAECVSSIQLILAIKENDITKCSGLKGKLSYNCEIDILNIQAQEKLDTDICEKIIPDSNLATSDPSIGYLYEGARTNCIDNITIKLAINDMDSDLCNSIKDTETQKYCKNEIINQEKQKLKNENIEEEVESVYEENENVKL